MASRIPDPPTLDPLEKETIDHLFVLQPGYAVGLGLHQYDGRVPDLSTAATERWIAGARALLGRLTAVSGDSLPEARRIDALLLRLLLESPLFDLVESRDLERNPMTYLGGFSLTPYLSRDYAPAGVRVDAILQVLGQVRPVLAIGRQRLDAQLPKPFVDLGLAIGGGLPQHFAEAEEFAARVGRAPEVAAARSQAEGAVREFLEWLRNDRLPSTTPDFALGASRYQKLLYVREGIEAPFDEIRRAGLADLARNRTRLEEIARAQGVAVGELFARVNRNHPPAADLLATARRFVEESKAFVADRRLVTIPDDVSCRVEETPAWGRALSTASMNPPGPFDPGPPEGIYYVTPVDPAWTPVQQEEWLRAFNFSMLRNITVHEVYPGHYLQFLHFRSGPGSLSRKVYLSPSFVEGWAHYTEQLAIEQGLGSDSYQAEVAQIHDALLRDCRLLVSIGLHTAGMTLEQATQTFQQEAYFERLPAEREAIRGTFNPEYFCYTLGKLAILNARSRFLAGRYAGDLRAFHDALLGFGCPPIGLLDTLFEQAGA
ncbi:MAG TPA: DUF885 domain-containing protein [Thermoplasmata archaeon]|nr:DUF885 domain-containing protein [Thermoplasmata archaeon]